VENLFLLAAKGKATSGSSWRLFTAPLSLHEAMVFDARLVPRTRPLETP